MEAHNRAHTDAAPGRLILEVLSRNGEPMSEALAKEFTEEGGTIGRGADNDMRLDDPGKYISRTHARIVFRAGQFFLADLGSNPSIINDRPLGIGKEVALVNGDEIQLGAYLLGVRIVGIPASDTPTLLEPVFPDSPAAEPEAILEEGYLEEGIFLTDAALTGADILRPADKQESALDVLGNGAISGKIAVGYQGSESDRVPVEQQSMNIGNLSVAKNIPEEFTIGLGKGRKTSVPGPDLVKPGVQAHARAPDLRADKPPQPVPHSEPMRSAMYAAGEEDNAVLMALLRGMGLPDLPLKCAPTDLAEQAGAMLRAATAGTIELLNARRLSKRASGIDDTMLASRENNALKFFHDADSALTQMLAQPMRGYLPGVQAYTSAFEDLKSHELAVMAGMQAALSALLNRLDPNAQEKKMVAPSAFDKMMPSRRKAKLWDRLVELYDDVAREADDDFQRMVSAKFSTAYKEQVHRLRQQD